MPLKAFGVASVLVGATATATVGTLSASGIHSVFEVRYNIGKYFGTKLTGYVKFPTLQGMMIEVQCCNSNSVNDNGEETTNLYDDGVEVVWGCRRRKQPYGIGGAIQLGIRTNQPPHPRILSSHLPIASPSVRRTHGEFPASCYSWTTLPPGPSQQQTTDTEETPQPQLFLSTYVCGWEEINVCGLKGAVCFFRGKTSAVCGPHLQTSATEEVDQTSAVCNKKTVCFLTSADY
ncbi:hypothetical protein LXL04_001557 [Taraxacum kok-saghyz]